MDGLSTGGQRRRQETRTIRRICACASGAAGRVDGSTPDDTVGGGRRRVRERRSKPAGRVEIQQADPSAMGDAAERFEILGAARAFRSRGSVSRSGAPLGLDNGSNETGSAASEGVVLIRAYGFDNAGGGSRGG